MKNFNPQRIKIFPIVYKDFYLINCFIQTYVKYIAGTANSNNRMILILIKTLDQIVPKIMPKEIIETLSKLTCHHFNVIDLNIFILPPPC